MRAFNRGEILQALAQALGLKGDLEMKLEELLLPVFPIGDLSDTPYLRFGIGVQAGSTAAAVAAKFTMLAVTPGSRESVQVRQIIMSNDSAALRQTRVMLMTAANVAALTTGASIQQQLRDVTSGEAGLVRPSATLAGANATILGNQLARIMVPVGQSVIWNLPAPGIILNGNDPGGAGALAMWNDTLNDTMIGSFVGRVWPLPG